MPSTIEVPLWLAIVTSLLAALAAVRLFAMPVLNWYRARRQQHAVDRVNARLRLGVPAFLITKRSVIVDRLVYDTKVQALAEKTAEKTGEPLPRIISRIEHYAEEIVPAFSVLFYFRLGYRLARWLLRLHYSVRTVFVDDLAFEAIDSSCTVVMVLNHRSNMDVLLVNYLASRRSTLSHAAGEWARLWPFQRLVRAAGNYVVDRNAKDPLYRCVLQRYVVMATAAGVHQAIFPEGRLSRDARMHRVKLGLLTYITKAFDPASTRDIVFIPVAVNYDRVPEDRRLVYEQEKDFRDRGKWFLVRSSLRYCLEVAGLGLRRREDRFGYACASFGHPISWREWLAQHHIDAEHFDREHRFACVSALGEQLKADIERIIPVLPVPVIATSLLSDPQRTWTLEALRAHADRLMSTLEAAGAQIYLPDEGQDPPPVGLRLLLRRKLIEKTDGGYRIQPDQLPLLRYYANSIAHLMPGVREGV